MPVAGYVTLDEVLSHYENITALFEDPERKIREGETNLFVDADYERLFVDKLQAISSLTNIPGSVIISMAALLRSPAGAPSRSCRLCRPD